MICQSCGVEATTRQVTFRQNIGILIRRFYKTIDGRLCRTCINKYFWEYTGITLVLGWWGVISFFATIYILINNSLNYLKSLGMPPVPPYASRPRLTESAVERLAAHTNDIANRIRDGETIEQIAQEVAVDAGVTPGQVVQFIRAAAGLAPPDYSAHPVQGFRLWWGLVIVGLIAAFCFLAYLGILLLLPPQSAPAPPQPTEIPPTVTRAVLSLNDAVEGMLQEAYTDGRGFVDEYYSRISYETSGRSLEFYVTPSPSDEEESLYLTEDLLFYGALALSVADERADTIGVTFFDSEDAWVRFYIDADYMISWINIDEAEELDFEGLYDNLQYEASPAVLLETEGDVTFDGRKCVHYQDAGRHVGEYTCVYGIVTHTYDSENASFVNFDDSRSSFYLVSFDYYMEGLDLEGRCVAALGSIGTYNGRSQIEVLYPDAQMQFCSHGAPQAPPSGGGGSIIWVGTPQPPPGLDGSEGGSIIWVGTPQPPPSLGGSGE